MSKQTLMKQSEREQFWNTLNDTYPNPRCELNYTNDFSLMVAIILSAQSTDKNVNKVTEKLFPVADTPQKMIELGIDTFLCGMAIGFDLAAAEITLSLKRKNPSIRLVACVPCVGQEKYFSKGDQKRYVAALKKADEKVILSENYYKGCMQVRDKYMAERADVMIAYSKKQEGGTAYTVRCFQKKNPNGKIIFL
jgi:uncharacterized phage-like protein YoqJ